MNISIVLVLLLTISFMSPVSAQIGGQSTFGYINPDNILPYTGIGTDYMNSYIGANRWTYTTFDRDGVTYYGHVDLLNYWKPLFHTPRMGFTFRTDGGAMSSYNKDKLENMLQLFAARNIKPIMMQQNQLPTRLDDNYVGSPEMTDNWLNIFLGDWVTNGKLDSRIAGISLFSETNHEAGIDNGMGVYNNLYSGVETLEDVAEYFSWLTREIHKIDPDIVVFYPFLGLLRYDTNSVIQVIRNTGIFNEPNVIFDIAHPYYFENWVEWGTVYVPTQEHAIQHADFQKEHYLIPWVNALGAERCWIGETFMFTNACRETKWIAPAENGAVQQTYWTRLVNHFVDLKIGFQLWALLGYAPYTPWDVPIQKADLHVEAINDSNYGKQYIGTYDFTPTPEPASFPTTLVLASIVIVSVGLGIFAYFKKYRER